MANSSSEQKYFCLSLWPLNMPQTHLITWATLTAILSPITVFANALLIYSLYKTKQLGSITNKFILVMNICDLLIGLIVLPNYSIMILSARFVRSCTHELVLQFLALCLAYFSFFMLVCVSIDRYIHVTKLMQYNKYMNEFRMKLIILFCGIMCTAMAAVFTFLPSFPLHVIFNSTDLLVILFMCILYAKVFKKINVHVDNLKQMLGNNGAANSKRDVNRELSATKTIRVLLVTLLALYLPYNFASPVWTYYKFHKRTNPPLPIDMVEYFAYLFIFSNTAVNAFIFIFGNSVTRNFIADKFGIPKIRAFASEIETAQKTDTAMKII